MQNIIKIYREQISFHLNITETRSGFNKQLSKESTENLDKLIQELEANKALVSEKDKKIIEITEKQKYLENQLSEKDSYINGLIKKLFDQIELQESENSKSEKELREKLLRLENKEKSLSLKIQDLKVVEKQMIDLKKSLAEEKECSKNAIKDLRQKQQEIDDFKIVKSDLEKRFEAEVTTKNNLQNILKERESKILKLESNLNNVKLELKNLQKNDSEIRDRCKELVLNEENFEERILKLENENKQLKLILEEKQIKKDEICSSSDLPLSTFDEPREYYKTVERSSEEKSPKNINLKKKSSYEQIENYQIKLLDKLKSFKISSKECLGDLKYSQVSELTDLENEINIELEKIKTCLSADENLLKFNEKSSSPHSRILNDQSSSKVSEYLKSDMKVVGNIENLGSNEKIFELKSNVLLEELNYLKSSYDELQSKTFSDSSYMEDLELENKELVEEIRILKAYAFQLEKENLNSSVFLAELKSKK